jgi:hypothetical protein
VAWLAASAPPVRGAVCLAAGGSPTWRAGGAAGHLLLVGLAHHGGRFCSPWRLSTVIPVLAGAEAGGGPGVPPARRRRRAAVDADRRQPRVAVRGPELLRESPRYRRSGARERGIIDPRLEDVCRQSETWCAASSAQRGRPSTATTGSQAAGGRGLLPPPARSAAMPSVIDSGNALVRETSTRAPILFREARQDLTSGPWSRKPHDPRALTPRPARPCGPAVRRGPPLALRKARRGEFSRGRRVLGAMARRASAALWFARLAERRNRQLSAPPLSSTSARHQNRIGLSSGAERAPAHGNPDFQRDALKTLEQMVAGLTAPAIRWPA